MFDCEYTLSYLVENAVEEVISEAGGRAAIEDGEEADVVDLLKVGDMVVFRGLALCFPAPSGSRR